MSELYKKLHCVVLGIPSATNPAGDLEPPDGSSMVEEQSLTLPALLPPVETPHPVETKKDAMKILMETAGDETAEAKETGQEEETQGDTLVQLWDAKMNAFYGHKQGVPSTAVLLAAHVNFARAFKRSDVKRKQARLMRSQERLKALILHSNLRHIPHAD
eukprot:Platyproteum_vivax@DN1297_c0_g1_i1.p1